mmetsp:Transcript_21388/g.71952  ORF Transcript_21388/g.71952 Transcript_21388/m.71952 type:complete len:244 (+) Transcript_21388:399-1130(+)
MAKARSRDRPLESNEPRPERAGCDGHASPTRLTLPDAAMAQCRTVGMAGHTVTRACWSTSRACPVASMDSAARAASKRGRWGSSSIVSAPRCFDEEGVRGGRLSPCGLLLPRRARARAPRWCCKVGAGGRGGTAPSVASLSDVRNMTHPRVRRGRGAVVEATRRWGWSDWMDRGQSAPAGRHQGRAPWQRRVRIASKGDLARSIVPTSCPPRVSIEKVLGSIVAARFAKAAAGRACAHAAELL